MNRIALYDWKVILTSVSLNFSRLSVTSHERIKIIEGHFEF